MFPYQAWPQVQVVQGTLNVDHDQLGQVSSTGHQIMYQNANGELIDVNVINSNGTVETHQLQNLQLNHLQAQSIHIEQNQLQLDQQIAELNQQQIDQQHHQQQLHQQQQQQHHQQQHLNHQTLSIIPQPQTTATTPLTQSSKKKKQKVNKDGVPAPKRATTAYINFTQWYREEIKKTGRTVPKIGEFGKECATKWNSMSEEDKKPFVTEAAKDRDRYKKEMAAFKPNKDDGKPKRPGTAFMLFMADLRKEMAGKEPEGGVAALAKLGGERWRGMNEDNKRPYVERQNEEKQRYEEKMEEYRRSSAVSSTPTPTPTALNGSDGITSELESDSQDLTQQSLTLKTDNSSAPSSPLNKNSTDQAQLEQHQRQHDQDLNNQQFDQQQQQRESGENINGQVMTTLPSMQISQGNTLVATGYHQFANADFANGSGNVILTNYGDYNQLQGDQLANNSAYYTTQQLPPGYAWQ